MLHGVSLRLTTMTFSMLGVCFNASSAMPFSGMLLPARNEVFEVMSSRHAESVMRPARASALNPPKTIEWIAPIRVQASIVMGNSGIMGR